MAFKTVLKGVEARMSDNIISNIYGVMRIHDEQTDGYCIVQWISKPYTQQEDKFMEGYEPPIKSYAGEIVCNENFQSCT